MDYKKQIIQMAKNKIKQFYMQKNALAGFGTFLIKAEVPRKSIHKFKDEYKILSHMGNFESWNFDLDKYITLIDNKWDIEYRLYFNAPAEKLESLREQYGDRIKQGGPMSEYMYHIDDNALIKNLIRDGAHLGVNS